MKDEKFFEMEVLISKISEKLKKEPENLQAATDMYQMCYLYPGAATFREGLTRAEASCQRAIRSAVKAKDAKLANAWMDLHEQIL